MMKIQGRVNMNCPDCNTYLLPLVNGPLENIYYCPKCEKKIKEMKAIRLPENAEFTCDVPDDWDELNPTLQITIPKIDHRQIILHRLDDGSELKHTLEEYIKNYKVLPK